MLTPSMLQQFTQARHSRDPRFDGRFFVAVKSTGIFCRPICPAQLPLEKNVSYYLLSQQALENGYRPCLRCRPDSAPGSFAWLGVTTTVKRALKMLSEELHCPITHIAAKLGISERYLSQLISKETGLSPKRFQLHSRLLMAKQLLQQTSLTVTDVSLAVGFQSTRGLQTQLKKQFNLTPSQLRKNSATLDSTLCKIFVPAKQPYNWPQVQQFLATRAIRTIERVDAQSYSRTFAIDQQPGKVVARFNEARSGFNVTITTPNPAHIYIVLKKLKQQLDVDTDPYLISQALENSGVQPQHITQGLRLPGSWSFFEAGVRAILGQQVSINAAITHVNRLSESLGERVDSGRLFPTAQQIAASDLSMLKMPQRRKQALKDFALAFEEAESEVLTDDRILNIKGVGPWTLQYMKLRGLAEPDIFLANDLIVKREAEKWRIISDKAAPWRSYLTIQLWHNAA